MITIGQIFDRLCELYPPHTACDFDNVGILVGGRDFEVKRALITLDCDKTALDRAVEGGFDLIITHHPVIFDGLKQIRDDSVVYRLIENHISVISMHTNLDIGAGGVNDCLCAAIGLENIETVTADDGFLLRAGFLDGVSPDSFAHTLKKALGGGVRYVAGVRPINRVLVCSGSGGGYLDTAIKGGFDALVTADVKHNVFVDAINNGISLFDAGHYHTEITVLDPLSKTLSQSFPEIKFSVYKHDIIKSI